MLQLCENILQLNIYFTNQFCVQHKTKNTIPKTICLSLKQLKNSCLAALTSFKSMSLFL